jgi:AraC-like DNA-binding protein
MMDNLPVSIARRGMVPPACDAQAGQRQTGKESIKPTDPPAKHGVSLGKVRIAMSELCSAIRSALDDERGTAEDSLRRAAEILREMGEADSSAQEQFRGGLAPWQVRKVTSYVDANLDCTIRNEDLATIVRLNPSHFGRVFRNSFGEPPHEYVIRRRVERAQGLMLSTSAPLSAIALDCGLADQAHLSRLFRRVVGETPRAWRRARIGEPTEAA